MAPKNRFLSPEPLKKGSRLQLSEEESHHLLKVLRLGPGAEVLLFDGKGGLAQAGVREATKRIATVEVGEVNRTEAVHRVHLVFGVTKAPSIDFILHRVTELGVASFQPLHTQHSLRLASANTERWQKILLETAKQCEELHLPRIEPLMALTDWLKGRDQQRKLFLCDEVERGLAHSTEVPADAEILVGPEGGWSREEVDACLVAGASKVSLGKNRLRAETACLVAIALVKKIVGEL